MKYSVTTATHSSKTMTMCYMLVILGSKQLVESIHYSIYVLYTVLIYCFANQIVI